ncbi:MAG: hypothetical protein E6I62_08390 [Chloroflexi bacterium]|nr:MAG: hypothetical protein E6I62_08390 [Chloroflexota bacterium]
MARTALVADGKTASRKAVPELVDETGRAFDIGEEERDGTGRELGHGVMVRARQPVELRSVPFAALSVAPE